MLPSGVTHRYASMVARLGIRTHLHAIRHYSATELCIKITWRPCQVTTPRHSPAKNSYTTSEDAAGTCGIGWSERHHDVAIVSPGRHGAGAGPVRSRQH